MEREGGTERLQKIYENCTFRVGDLVFGGKGGGGLDREKKLNAAGLKKINYMLDNIESVISTDDSKGV